MQDSYQCPNCKAIVVFGDTAIPIDSCSVCGYGPLDALEKEDVRLVDVPGRSPRSYDRMPESQPEIVQDDREVPRIELGTLGQTNCRTRKSLHRWSPTMYFMCASMCILTGGMVVAPFLFPLKPSESQPVTIPPNAKVPHESASRSSVETVLSAVPPQPPDPKSIYEEACAEAKRWLLSEFEYQIDAMRNGEDPESRQSLVASLRRERTTFQAFGTIPFSPAMRTAAGIYIKKMEIARVSTLRACELALSSMEKIPRQEDRRLHLEMTNFKETMARGTIVGIWRHEDNRNTRTTLYLWSTGALIRSNGQLPGTWVLTDSSLVLISPSPQTRLGAWVDLYTVSSDGQSFTGKNQGGYAFTGTRIDP